jgi:hypothetical protein
MKTGFSLYVHGPGVYMYCLAIFGAVFFIVASYLTFPFVPFIGGFFSIVAGFLSVIAFTQALSIYTFERKFK